MTEKKKGGTLTNVRSEYKKVVWPTKKQTAVYTFTVVSIAILIALFCWVLDLVFNAIVGFII